MESVVPNHSSSRSPLAILVPVTLAAGAVLAASPGFAAVSLTVGGGTALSRVDGAADFESMAALNGNPYVEGGLSFSRTGLSFDNNGCGFAGCAGHDGIAGFSGNYMYGAGRGYFEIRRASGERFTGLEFLVGSGIPSRLVSVVWTAYLDNVVVGGGQMAGLPAGTVLGFAGGDFDTLRYTDIATNNGLPNVPAFDSVLAQFAVGAGSGGGGAVPEPAAWTVMILGFGLAGAGLRRGGRTERRAA